MSIPISNRSNLGHFQRLRNNLLESGSGLPFIALRYRPKRKRISRTLQRFTDAKPKLNIRILDNGYLSKDGDSGAYKGLHSPPRDLNASTCITNDLEWTPVSKEESLRKKDADSKKLKLISHPRHFQCKGIPSKDRKELSPSLNIEGKNITKEIISTGNDRSCNNSQITPYKLAISRKDIPCVSSTLRQKNKKRLEHHVSLPLFNISLIDKCDNDLDIEKISSARHDLETLLRNNGKRSPVNSNSADSIENQCSYNILDTDGFIPDMKNLSLANNGGFKDNVPVTQKINTSRSQSSALDNVRANILVPTREMCKSAPTGMNCSKPSPRLKYSHRDKEEIKTEKIKEIQKRNTSVACKSLEVAGTNDGGRKKPHWPTYYDVNNSYDQSHKYVLNIGTPSPDVRLRIDNTRRNCLRGGKLSKTSSRRERGIGNIKTLISSVKKEEHVIVDTDKPKRKLEPIIVPSHTETFCPMCRNHFENNLDFCVSCCGSGSDVSADDSLGEECDIELDESKSEILKIEDGYAACCSSPANDASNLHIQGIALQ